MTARKIVPTLLWMIAFTLVGWVLAKLPLSTITSEILNLSFMEWLAWISINMCIIFLATYRWLILTRSLTLPVNFFALLLIRQAGQGVSFITPGPQFGGEPLQVYWLCNRKIAVHRALLAVGLDRFFELGVNIGVLLISVCLLALSDAIKINLSKIVIFLLVIGILIALCGTFILAHPAYVLNWLNRIANYWQHHPRLLEMKTHWMHLNDELVSVFCHQKIALINAFIFSLLGWCGLIGELWLLLSFFHLNIDMNAFVVIFVAMRLAFLFPLPGGIGTLETAMFWAFSYLHFPESSALGVIALMRLRDAVVLISGFACLKGLNGRE